MPRCYSLPAPARTAGHAGKQSAQPFSGCKRKPRPSNPKPFNTLSNWVESTFVFFQVSLFRRNGLVGGLGETICRVLVLETHGMRGCPHLFLCGYLVGSLHFNFSGRSGLHWTYKELNFVQKAQQQPRFEVYTVALTIVVYALRKGPKLSKNVSEATCRVRGRGCTLT